MVSPNNEVDGPPIAARPVLFEHWFILIFRQTLHGLVITVESTLLTFHFY